MTKAMLVDAYLGAISNADAGALDQILAPGFTFALPQPAMNIVPMSRDEAIIFLTNVPESLLETRTMTFEKLHVAETGSDYIIELRITASLKGGGVYDNLYMLWFHCSDDKIQWCREHTDTAYVQALNPPVVAD